MPFKETCPVEERIALFRDYETGVFTVSERCRGISRETFYVWNPPPPLRVVLAQHSEIAVHFALKQQVLRG